MKTNYAGITYEICAVTKMAVENIPLLFLLVSSSKTSPMHEKWFKHFPYIITMFHFLLCNSMEIFMAPIKGF